MNSAHRKDARGTFAVEFGLLALLLAVAGFALITPAGTELAALYGVAAGAL